MADRVNRTGYGTQSCTEGDSPSNAALVRFLADARSKGADSVRVAVAYDATAIHHPDYAARDRLVHDKWHFLDQVQNTLERSDPSVKYVEIPYQAGSGAELVFCHAYGADSILFQGKEVPF